MPDTKRFKGGAMASMTATNCYTAIAGVAGYIEMCSSGGYGGCGVKAASILLIIEFGRHGNYRTIVRYGIFEVVITSVVLA